MEISHLHIAKLVLGYLKIEKCKSAYSEFLNSSIYLKEYRNKQEKYIVTRVLGLSLVDLVLNYAQIHTIVQGRLEHTDYFNDGNHSDKLVNQLIYLLDNPNQFSSRACTPGAFSRCSTPNKEYSRDRHTVSQNLSIIEETISPNINATPLKSLPGNNNDVNESTTPKRKVSLPSNRSHRTTSVQNANESEKELSDKTDVENSSDEHDKCMMESAVNQFAQTLLDHHELQEKIAQNINTINDNDDIDHAIKAVLEKTESDPLFETLMGDILGSVRDLQNTSDLANKINLHPAEEVPNTSQNKSATKEFNTSIDQQNNVAIDSIISASQMNPLAEIKQTLPKTDLNERLSVNTSNGDILLYDGTFENYVKAGGSLNTPTPQVQPQILSGLLMMNTTNQTPMQSYINTTDPMKCIFVNSTPVINMAPKPQTQYVLTEQDIMTMPTVILCDEPKKQPPVKKKEPGKIKTIMPKKKNEKTQTLSDYITLYKCNDSMEEAEIDRTAIVKKSVPKAKPKSLERKQTAIVHVEILPETSSIFSAHTEIKPEQPINTNIVENNEIKIEENVINEIKPENKTPQDKMSTRSCASSPRSGNRSHVRALNFKFETPGKEILLKKPDSTPKSNKKKKSPVKAVSKSVKTLFTSPTKNVKSQPKNIKTHQLMKKSGDKVLKSWDAALREIPTKDPTVIKSPSPKRKRRKSVNVVKKSELNKTLEDAMKIEAALNASNEKINEEINKSTSSNEENNERVSKRTRKQTKSTPKSVMITKGKIVDDESNESETLICNIDKPKYKKKCNVDNSIKKDIKITKVKELRTLEIVSESTDKLILSPSKLNANKRSLVEDAKIIPQATEVPMIDVTNSELLKTEIVNIDDTDSTKMVLNSAEVANNMEVTNSAAMEVANSASIEVANSAAMEVSNSAAMEVSNSIAMEDTNPIDLSTSATNDILHSDLMLSVEKPTKFLTPEMMYLQTMGVPNTAKRNIIPMLETPVKSIFPTNSGFFSPINTNDTPYTKVFKQQCEGVDLTSIPTPKFPLTPNFPFTPLTGTQSPHSNRPTDYSTSSSYYQPSETDQDKSLELYILEECKSKKSETKTQVNELKPEVPVSDIIEKCVGGSNQDEEIELVVQKDPQKAIADQMKSMGTSVIGRKNLNLVRKNSSDTSSSGESGTESSSDDSTSSDNSWIAGSANETVVKKSRDNSLSRYSLRSKTSTNNSPQEKQQKNADDIKNTSTSNPVEDENKPTDEIKNILSNTEFKPVLKKDNPIFDYQEKVLKEMDEKRKRTIDKLKCESVPEKPVKATPKPKKVAAPRKRPPPKNPKPTNSKPTNTKTTNTKPNPRTLRSNSVKQIKIEPICEPAHLSSDNDHIQPLEIVETEMLSSSQSITAMNEIKPDLNRLLSFENVLKHNTSSVNTNTIENTGTTEPEVEVLLNGLKEMGIHLIHNKSPMKAIQATPMKSQIPIKTNKLTIKTPKKANLTKLTIKSKPVKTIRSKSTEAKKLCLKRTELTAAKEYCLKTTETITEAERRSLSKPPEDLDEDSTQYILTNFFTDDATHIVYNDSNPDIITRNIDFKLPRMLKNNIYIGDDLVDICLTVTPHSDLLNILPVDKMIKKHKEINIISNITISNKKCHPLKMLMNEMEEEITDCNLEMARQSPLDDLYSSDKVDYRKKNNNLRNTKKPARCRDVNPKIGDDKVSTIKRSSTSRDRDKKDSTIVNKLDKTTKVNENNGKNGKKTLEEIVGTLMDREDKKIELPKLDVVEVDPKSVPKRKADSELESGEPKKVKSDVCHQLLKGLEIDDFLQKIHGEVKQ